MLRNKVFRFPADRLFRYRGNELFRVEGLSDAVFAFSISLLVLSLEVPQSFKQLKLIATGAFPFFATVAMLFLFWHIQYRFFRRYGLNDRTTVFLNLCYLAVLLFYVYPLKFLFSLLFMSWTGVNLFEKATAEGVVILERKEFPQLVDLFSCGYMTLWMLVYFMHRHALRQRAKLELTTYELLFTRRQLRGALLNVLVGLASFSFGLIKQDVLASVPFFLIPLLMFVNNRLFKADYKRSRRAAIMKSRSNLEKASP